ncbi:hypothetical protein K438DRAFT_1552107, partial [Mycena galopus ATCC 62051]
GVAWSALVRQWFLREEGKGFITPVKGHSTKLRPAQVEAWVQRARNGVPDIKDVLAFAAEWAVWWEDINPPWRKGSHPMPKTDGDWTVMNLPGQNGFLNVLICLKWW